MGTSIKFVSRINGRHVILEVIMLFMLTSWKWRLFMLFIFRGYYVIFLKSGVNFYISLWNAKFMQETLQESNEKMHCDGGLPQYKTSRKIKACNKSKQGSWLFIDQWPGEDTNTWTNPIGLNILFYTLLIGSMYYWSWLIQLNRSYKYRSS